jgi:hypothetical protein
MTETPQEIGRRIGRAMARDAIAEGMPSGWTGLDAQDADRATAAGLEPDTAAWADMEAAAREEYEHRVREAAR